MSSELDDLSSEQLAAVDEFASITNAPRRISLHILKASKWNMEIAAMIFYQEFARVGQAPRPRRCERVKKPRAARRPGDVPKPAVPVVSPKNVSVEHHPAPPPGWLQNLFVGSKIDARDKLKKWYSATILEIDGCRYHVTFDGWKEKHNEWIDARKCDRIRPYRTVAVGGKEASCKCKNCVWIRFLNLAVTKTEHITSELSGLIECGDMRSSEDLAEWQRERESLEEDKSDERSLLEKLWVAYDENIDGILQYEECIMAVEDFLLQLSNRRQLHNMIYRLMGSAVDGVSHLRYQDHPRGDNAGRVRRATVEKQLTAMVAISTEIAHEELLEVLSEIDSVSQTVMYELDADKDGVVTRAEFLAGFPRAVRRFIALRDAIIYSRRSAG